MRIVFVETTTIVMLWNLTKIRNYKHESVIGGEQECARVCHHLEAPRLELVESRS